MRVEQALYQAELRALCGGEWYRLTTAEQDVEHQTIRSADSRRELPQTTCEGPKIASTTPSTQRGETRKGLHRYISPQQELTGLLTSIGLDVTQVRHFVKHVFPDTPPDAYMLKATRP